MTTYNLSYAYPSSPHEESVPKSVARLPCGGILIVVLTVDGRDQIRWFSQLKDALEHIGQIKTGLNATPSCWSLDKWKNGEGLEKFRANFPDTLMNMNLEDIYLEWVNNFLTVDRMAEHYGVSVEVFKPFLNSIISLRREIYG